MPVPAIHFNNQSGPHGCDYQLFPYEQFGCLVFDDPAFDLVAEELVCGADDLARFLSRDMDGPYSLLISTKQMPASHELRFLRMEGNGYHTYTTEIEEVPTVGLCPNFLHYYPQPPASLYFIVTACER